MTDTQLQPYEKKSPIVMKGGIVHMVEPETGAKIQEALAAQGGHRFIRISELGITINSAEVEGVYTMDQYDEITKVQAGLYKCAYAKWHKKRETCECRADWLKDQRSKAEARQREDENRPLSDEERAAQRERFTVMNERAALDGKPGSIWQQLFYKGNRGQRKMRRSTIDAWEKETGKTANLEGLAIEEDVLASIMD